MTAATNRHEFRVYAMKRSGHHAVMAWLMRHFTGPIYFLNNCSFANGALFSSTRVGRFIPQPEKPAESPLFSGRVSIFFDGGEMSEQVEHLQKSELLDEPLVRLDKLARAERELLENPDCSKQRDAYLFNLEDFDLDHFASIPFAQTARGTSKTVHDLIVLRDPYNWLASRYQGQFPIDQEVIDAWNSHCREALGETSILNNPTIVNYDRWFADSAYREELTSQLGLTGPEPGIGEMTNFGGGSSFSGMEFRTQAEQMDVLNRWRFFQEDPAFQKLFDGQEELIALAGRMFPEGPRPEFL